MKHIRGILITLTRKKQVFTSGFSVGHCMYLNYAYVPMKRFPAGGEAFRQRAVLAKIIRIFRGLVMNLKFLHALPALFLLVACETAPTTDGTGAGAGGAN
ncbi:MAG: hypothetical protein J0L97_10370, partial [Alphaproteobacteria bacterium]|nr:hypothetical protein [Alphaproteobacteria bacterium]